MRRIALFCSLLLACLVTSQAQAAPTSILQRPYDLDSGHGVLRGTLLLPQTQTPPPVALLIAGSGPTDRDGNNPEGGQNAYLRKLAEALAENGIASVRYDKRGVARSLPAAPREEELSVEAYVSDVVAWSDKLAHDPRFGRQVLIGHSEGALIASLAAPQTHAEALVSLAGSARPIGDVLREQLQGRLPPPLLAQADQLIDRLQAGQLQPKVPEPLKVLFRPSVQPYLVSLFRQDPARAFAALKLPTQILQGTNDIQVGVEDAQALKRAKPDSDFHLISGMNHILRIVPTSGPQQLASYNNPNLPLARELVERVTTFIRHAQTLPDATLATSGANVSRNPPVRR
ncbi:lysophospholipase [Pseudomonas sp. GD04087]|uniref:alpha/beta hydrolase n=1 Tax=unclassified Pseudomonas TaxID=196821 RepID=UPI002447A365|nr:MULTISPECIES: alpha/beta fold hydrolase [unclassified Pseudomonas]MDH0291370.1 lysophospholipase [Pseudomonas sp. GD04087]MDH1049453.1 lysophospholipase [Pseudomonas sp. GD03903]MDH2000053.1 lysophospholipase [Pseudomonas sp. GD03691]